MAIAAPLVWPGKVAEKTLLEVIDRADRMLAGQLTLAIAADARATSQANILITLAAALLAAFAAYFTQASPNVWILGFLVAAALGVMAGAAMSGYAARPVDFYPNGYQPKNVLERAADRPEMLRWVADCQQAFIDHNAEVLSQTAYWTEKGYQSALISIAVLIIAIPAVSFFSPHSSSSAQVAPVKVPAHIPAPGLVPAPVANGSDRHP